MRLIINQAIYCIALALVGCGTTLNTECDDAIPQAEGTLRVGLAGSMVTETEDDYSKHIGIEVGDNHIHLSGKLNARFGLSAISDMTASFLYVTYPGYGLQVGYKKVLTESTLVKTAIYGSAQYFSTENEVPYWEVAKHTYNRKFSNLTFGVVGSIALPKMKPMKPDSYALISAGAKLSLNYADVRELVEYYPSTWTSTPQSNQTIQNFNYYYTATPYLMYSIRNDGGSLFFAELQWPIAYYDTFRISRGQGLRMSLGFMFQVFDVH